MNEHHVQSASRKETAQEYMDKAREWIQEHPGTALLIGLAVGGLIGWLTSRRK